MGSLSQSPPSTPRFTGAALLVLPAAGVQASIDLPPLGVARAARSGAEERAAAAARRRAKRAGSAAVHA